MIHIEHILVFIIFVILLILLNKKRGYIDTFYNPSYVKDKIRQQNKNKSNKDMNNLIDELLKSADIQAITKSYGNITKPQLNMHFVNNQYHTDFKDVLSAINEIIPSSKQLFNIPNIPVTRSVPNKKAFYPMINNFALFLNKIIKTRALVQDDKDFESGWDKVNKQLGREYKLYKDNVKKTSVYIVDINKHEKHETEEEIKYICDLIIGKKHVNDQMILRLSFVQSKRPLQDENNFFVNDNFELEYKIEQIYVVGFLTKENLSNYDNQNPDDCAYEFDKLETNDMTDPHHIQDQLIQHYKTRTLEMNHFNAMLDEEGRDFHRDLPHAYDFEDYNVNGTRTIYDDMSLPKQFT